MEYEIYLTTKCTRNCAFCYVQKHNFVESANNVQKFIDYIKIHEHINSKFILNLFGGEPTLAIDSILQIVDQLVQYKNASINLITNGDILEHFTAYKQLQLLNIFLTPYDIFQQKQKYIDLIEKFPISQIQYTFTEDDIDNCYEFSNIANTIRIPYKIRFSNDPQSWKKIDVKDLYSTISKITTQELDLISNGELPIRSLMIIEPLSKLLISTFDANAKHQSCLKTQKMSFYDGKFYGKCIRFYDSQVDEDFIPQQCIDCKHTISCNHSCHAEIVDCKVDEKLCTIKHAQFDTIMDYVYNKKYNNNISQILQFLLKENNLLY